MEKDLYSISERFDEVYALLSAESNFIGCFSFFDECSCTIFEVSDISWYQLKELIKLKVHFTMFAEVHAQTSVSRFNVVQLWFSV